MKITERKLRSIIKSVIEESRFDDNRFAQASKRADKYRKEDEKLERDTAPNYTTSGPSLTIDDIMNMPYDQLELLSPGQRQMYRDMLDDKVSNLQDEIELLNSKRDELY